MEEERKTNELAANRACGRSVAAILALNLGGEDGDDEGLGSELEGEGLGSGSEGEGLGGEWNCVRSETSAKEIAGKVWRATLLYKVRSRHRTVLLSAARLPAAARPLARPPHVAV